MKKLLAIAILMCIVIVSLSAAALVIIHSGHDCVGELCQLCPMLKQVEQFIKAVVVAFFAIVFTFVMVFASIHGEKSASFISLIEVKTRMND
jgi:hypothetical protein